MNDDGRGYIKVPRSLLEWEWYTDGAVLQVYLYLMLSARWTGGKWRGIDVPAGGLITSFGRISNDAGLTEKQVRRAFDVLKSSGIIRSARADKGQLVTLANWAEIDIKGVYEGRQMAGKGQAKGTLRAGKGQAKGNTIRKEEGVEGEEGKNTSPSIEGEEPSADVSANSSTVHPQATPDPTPGSAAPLPGEEPKADHRDPRINELVDHLQKKLGHGLDGSAKANRFAASTLLKILAKEFPDFDALASTKALIDAATVDPFHAKNATNFDYLRRHWGAIAKASKERKSQTKHQTNDEYAKSVAEAFARKYGITDPA